MINILHFFYFEWNQILNSVFGYVDKDGPVDHVESEEEERKYIPCIPLYVTCTTSK